MSAKALSKSPHWTDLLKIKCPATQSQKKKKEYVTSEQREEMLLFIQNNPEMLTHSSTKENEASLWNDLAKKLNSMLPEKSVVSWQIIWKRWQSNIESKSESSLTIVDYKLKKFLKNVMANYENPLMTASFKKKISLEEICKNIEEVEAEKTKLKLDIDKMNYSVTVYQMQINELKKAIANNRKQCRQLSLRKANLNSKKRKIEEKENLSED